MNHGTPPNTDTNVRLTTCQVMGNKCQLDINGRNCCHMKKKCESSFYFLQLENNANHSLGNNKSVWKPSQAVHHSEIAQLMDVCTMS